jgi:glycerophosphoryl diester phosphodiesterase
VPENSLAGSGRRGAGVDVVEVDVRRTIDGVPVLIHDPILGRRTDGHGLVRLARARRVARRRLEGSGETVPTLDEAFRRAAGGGALGIHVKERGAVGAVLSTVGGGGSRGRPGCWWSGRATWRPSGGDARASG